MTTIYAAKDNLIIWSDRSRIHKAGRVPLGEPMLVIRLYEGWYEVERPTHISLPVQPDYPHYWVDPAEVISNTIQTPSPSPTPPLPAGDLEEAIATVIRFIRAIWKE